MNVDLCFVPETRDITEQKLPTVSGSSGRLVVERLPETEPHFPGQVFADEQMDYEQAMLSFVAASQTQSASTVSSATNDGTVKAQKRALHQEEEALRVSRRAVRQQRQLEDAAFSTLKVERREQKIASTTQPTQQHRCQDETWRVIRKHRQKTVAHRKQEDVVWREQRNGLRERLTKLPWVTAWIAILVVTDNCTRQCLGLPLFVTGPKVTSELIIDALRVLLPRELKFLITDRGTHFTAKAFEIFARSDEFIHVLIARHRPQSNGIAERFVRTLKEWLKDKTWHGDQELTVLLAEFLSEYNSRPHQGLSIPGLSPNEFANRIWLM